MIPNLFRNIFYSETYRHANFWCSNSEWFQGHSKIATAKFKQDIWCHNYSILEIPLWTEKERDLNIFKLLKNEKSFKGEIKNIFIFSLRAYFWWNLKIASVTLKEVCTTACCWWFYFHLYFRVSLWLGYCQKSGFINKLNENGALALTDFIFWPWKEEMGTRLEPETRKYNNT